MKTSTKGFAPIVIILIGAAVLALAGGGYWYYRYSPRINYQNSSPEQPTATNETANWKTYQNEKYGFEIKYPNDWKISEIIGKDTIDIGFSEDFYYINVTKISVPFSQWYGHQANFQTYPLNGYEGQTDGVELFLVHNSIVYQLPATNNPRNNIEIQKQIKVLESTFKFTK